MKFTALVASLSTAIATIDTASGAENSDTHLNLALDLAQEQGSTIFERDVEPSGLSVVEAGGLDKRGFFLLAKLKYLWAMKMKKYNLCYQCGGNICGSNCCSCGSPCEYQCSNC